MTGLLVIDCQCMISSSDARKDTYFAFVADALLRLVRTLVTFRAMSRFNYERTWSEGQSLDRCPTSPQL